MRGAKSGHFGEARDGELTIAQLECPTWLLAVCYVNENSDSAAIAVFCCGLSDSSVSERCERYRR